MLALKIVCGAQVGWGIISSLFPWKSRQVGRRAALTAWRPQVDVGTCLKAMGWWCWHAHSRNSCSPFSCQSVFLPVLNSGDSDWVPAYMEVFIDRTWFYAKWEGGGWPSGKLGCRRSLFLCTQSPLAAQNLFCRCPRPAFSRQSLISHPHLQPHSHVPII